MDGSTSTLDFGPEDSTHRLDDQTDADGLRRRLLTLFLPTMGLIVVCWWGTPIWLTVPTVIWTAYFFLCVTSLFHEFIHRFQHLRCLIWAKIFGTFLLTPATVYRESHLRHHAYLNRPVDWELWPYTDPQMTRGFRRAFAWLDLAFGILTSPYIYGRIYWSGSSPLSEKARRAITQEYLIMVVTWAAALTAITYFRQWPNFLRAWVLPAWIAGVMQTGRKFTEHLGMKSFDPLFGTRTVYGGNLFSRLCSWLNSDIFIHGPHHRTPRVTADELRTFARELQQTTPGLPFYRSYLAAFLAMLPHLAVNPGIGENAGCDDEKPAVTSSGTE
jgi:fatty acid desaturase